MITVQRHILNNLALFFLVALTAFRAAGQAPNGAWVYPSATGNLLYQLDSRGQRINDFSQCGYRGGTEPLPNVTALIPQSRWVYVSPGTGDDTVLIQAAIDSVEALTPDANGWRGVVYLNAGEYQLVTMPIVYSKVKPSTRITVESFNRLLTEHHACRHFINANSGV